MTVFAPLIGMAWRGIESYGLDPRIVIDENTYQPGRVSHHGDRIKFSAVEKIVNDCIRLTADPAFGLRAGEGLLPSHLGPLGYAWMASSSLKTSVERAQRFNRMYNEQEEILSSEEHGVFKVSQRLRHHSDVEDVLGDIHLSALLTLCRANFGKSLRPVFVRMRRSPPPDPIVWHDCFGVTVQFLQTENSMGIRSSDATKQLTGASRKMVLMHEDIIRHQMADMDRSEILNRTLASILEQLPSGHVSEVSVANALNMSKRTLHRKLGEKGVSFRSLLTNARKELVNRYIDEPTYSVTEISFLLGYSDTSAFSRAFKRWHGVSPTKARELM